MLNWRYCKVHPITGHEGPEVEYRYSSTLSLTLVLSGVGGQRHAPAALAPERPGTNCTEGWLDPTAGLDGCGKSRPPPGFDPQTVQPLASLYTGPLVHIVTTGLESAVTTQYDTAVQLPPSMIQQCSNHPVWYSSAVTTQYDTAVHNTGPQNCTTSAAWFT